MHTSKATPHMGSSHSGPAAAANWNPAMIPDCTPCRTCPGSRSQAPAAEADEVCSGSLCDLSWPGLLLLETMPSTLAALWSPMGTTTSSTTACMQSAVIQLSTPLASCNRGRGEISRGAADLLRAAVLTRLLGLAGGVRAGSPLAQHHQRCCWAAPQRGRALLCAAQQQVWAHLQIRTAFSHSTTRASPISVASLVEW